MLEAVAAVGGDGDVRVQAEALQAGAAWGGFLGTRRRAEPADRLAGSRTEGHATLEGRPDGVGKQKLLRRARVGGGFVLGCPAAPDEQAWHPAPEPRQQLPDVLIRGRRRGMESGRRRPCGARVDVVEDQAVEMDVEQEIVHFYLLALDGVLARRTSEAPPMRSFPARSPRFRTPDV